MDIGKELARPDSGCRRVLAVLERDGRCTQEHLAGQTDVTVATVCKALKILRAEGYVRFVGRGVNRDGIASGMRPGLYERTARVIAEYRATPCDDLGTLGDALNAMIRACR